MIIDTNILVRAIVQDEPQESARAIALLRANDVVVPNPTFCELIWVLARLYKFRRAELIEVIKAWSNAEGVIVDQPAVAAGLSVMERGGDFADGIVAFEGQRLGGRVFTTFDRKAADILVAQGQPSLLV